MKNITLIILLFTFIGFSQNVPEKYQQAKIFYNNYNDITLLNQIGIPVDHGIHKKNQYLISDFSISEIEKVKNAGFDVEILIEDSKEYFLQQNKSFTISRNNAICENYYVTPSNWNFGSMGGYYTYQEFLDEINDMHTLYPNLITAPKSISTFLTNGTPDDSTVPSIGGNPIVWLKISDNPNNSEGEPKTLHTAVHHAREPTSLSQLLFFMWYLLENYETDSEIKNIVDHTELYFIPVVNPDGYLYNEKTDPNGGGFWRKNRFDTNGVDVNRNYDYFIDGDPNNNIWGGEGTSADPTSDIYHGTSPFSEIESQAVKWFCEQHDFVLGLNHHSYGNGIFFPFGYTAGAFTPEHDLYLSFLEELTSKNNYFYAKTNGLAGTSNDFMYGTVGTHNKIYAITPEIGNQFWLPMEDIISTCKDMLYLNITASKMTNGGAKIIDNSSVYIGNQSTNNHDFELINLGLEGNGNFTISINPISSNIISVGNPIVLNNLEPMEASFQTIQYILEAGTQAGEDVVFEMLINNGTYNQTILTHKIFGASQAIFEDPGESVTDNFINNGWGLNNIYYVSPANSIADSPFALYEANDYKTITLSEEIDLTNALGANVTFYAKWDIESNKDYLQFEISTDNGITWIPQCGIYTTEGSGNGVQSQNEPLYDGSQTEWVLEDININDYLGEQILIRFEFQSDDNINKDGFYFDDLTVNIIDDGTLSITDVTETQFSVYPNPVDNLLFITTPVDNYSMSIYNIQGQLINTNSNLSGSQTIDYSGYSKGIYLMNLNSDSYIKTFKIIKN